MNDKKPPKDAGNGNGPAAWSSARLNRDIQAQIGQQLRKLHDDVVKEGVPDRFAELIDKLAASKDSTSKK